MGIMYFDASSVVVLILLLFSILTRKLYKTLSSKLFIIIIVDCIICCIFDILSLYPQTVGKEVLEISITGYYLTRNIMPLIYVTYLLELIDCWEIFKRHKLLIFLYLLPTIIILLLISINPLTNLLYYFEPENGIWYYYRGPGIAILYIFSVLYLFLGVFLIFKFKTFFRKIQLLAVFAIFPLTLISVLIQYLFPNYLIELFASTLCLILISYTIENQEKLIEPKTGLLTEELFIGRMRRCYAFKRNRFLLVIKVKNYNELYNLANYEDANRYIKQITGIFYNRYKGIDKTVRTYYLDDGLFVMTFSSYQYMDTVSRLIINEIESYNEIKIAYSPDVNLCLIDCLNDFVSYNDLFAFLNNYHTKIDFNERITIFKNIKDDRNFKLISNLDKVIDEAVAKKEFKVYYQPIYNVRKKRYKSAEALVRLDSPIYGFVSPGVFIPYAEKNGKIIKIDNYVMEEVFKFVSSNDFDRLGLEYVEINLSMAECVDPNLVNRISNLVNKYNVDPAKVNLEITESFDSVNTSLALENINKLIDLGFSFSLDDYGTGYSNIERFSSLPITIVKIDKSLVDSANSDRMNIVLKNTFKIIKDLNRETVVEGIETKEQVILFDAFGCDNIQGFYFSKPLPFDDFVKFIEDNNNV